MIAGKGTGYSRWIIRHLKTGSTQLDGLMRHQISTRGTRLDPVVASGPHDRERRSLLTFSSFTLLPRAIIN